MTTPATVRFTIKTTHGTVVAECPVIRRAIDDTITYDAGPLLDALGQLDAHEYVEVAVHRNATPGRWLDRLGLTILRRPLRWLGAQLGRL